MRKTKVILCCVDHGYLSSVTAKLVLDLCCVGNGLPLFRIGSQSSSGSMKVMQGSPRSPAPDTALSVTRLCAGLSPRCSLLR